MRLCTPIFGGALIVLLTGLVAHGEVKVVVERNDQAGAAYGVEFKFKFQFKNLRAPASNDAASGATCTLVEGLRDENGGPLRVLQDGKLPNTEDQPNRNFFFGQGQNGGRLVIDLGKVIDVGQVNTYSWHAGTRGPQVYKLFAADGAAPGFAAQPKNGTDPAGCGWTHVADVDTRPESGTGGGQYGVSISDSARAIGKYRYLLFCISATEQDDRFGNTFFSEIDIMEKPWLDDRINCALHWDGYEKDHKSTGTVVKVPGVMEGFHTFGLWWKADEYVFYVDGQETWRTSAGGVSQAAEYIKLSDEIGDWAGDIKKAEVPDQFLVDYVRVYDHVGEN
ncbi:MAG: glycoside hydrolase family 16 protein [Pirellulaceae bacterium]